MNEQTKREGLSIHNNPIVAPHKLRRSALIIAHPGHELLVHGWMEDCRPSVHVLSDGSGSSAMSRMAFSERIILSSGAALGSGAGQVPDRDWYAAILARDATLFLDTADRVAEDLSRLGCTDILCDPLEFYNPLHDLANAIAHRVGHVLGARVASYEMQKKRPQGEIGRREFAINDNRLTRKQKSIRGYTPLAQEAEDMSSHLTRRSETLYDELETYGWPEDIGLKPYYESFAEGRRDTGHYNEIITYRGHVRPVAQALLADLIPSG